MNENTLKLAYELEQLLYPNVYVDAFMDLVNKNGYIIIGNNGDVNWRCWHDGTLTHECFLLDASEPIVILSEGELDEFKQLVLNYYKEKEVDNERN